MDHSPRTKVTDVPTGLGKSVDVLAGQDFITIAAQFVLNPVRGVKLEKYTGISGYAHKAGIAFSFNDRYHLTDIEFRRPYAFLDTKELWSSGVNLLQPKLSDAWQALTEAGVTCERIDVGFRAPELGVSFFSDEYEDDLDVRLDAVCVHFSL